MNKLIAILDDFFPNILSAFRVAEFNHYLEHFPHLRIYSSNPDFVSVHAVYAQLYPQYAERVIQFNDSCLHGCSFVYVNFLNNAYNFLPYISKHCLPFLLTLYPGGGLGLNEDISDIKLEKVITSPLLRGIISTQKITTEYLEGKQCKLPIHDIYGVAVNTIYFENTERNSPLSADSGIISICFVAERYMDQGRNKGYPEFIAAAEILIRSYSHLRFSVVGNFGPEDILLSDHLCSLLEFLGVLPTLSLKEFFLKQDIIVSPNVPFVLHPGNFDGFPTACCVEASLCGVALVCTDELNLNQYYVDGVNILICKPMPESIVKNVRKLVDDPILLKNIQSEGQIVSSRLFNPKSQLDKRSTLLMATIENEDYLPVLHKKYISELKQYIESQRPKVVIMDVISDNVPDNLIQQIECDYDNNRKLISLQKQIIFDLNKQIISLSDTMRVLDSDRLARGRYINDLEQTVAAQNSIQEIKSDWIARGRFIEELEQLIAEKTDNIQKIESDWIARGQYIGELEHLIAEKTNNIQKIESDLNAQGQFVSKLEQSIDKQVKLISALEEDIMKKSHDMESLEKTLIEMQNSIFGKVHSSLTRLTLCLVRPKRPR